ncbi:MAG TPA: MlaD family protein [Planctomycetota bacterium]|nr:MlaD family protein [Planctomycetota bacterium]
MSRRRRNIQRNMVLGGFVLASLAVLTFLTFRLGGLGFVEQKRWTAYFGDDSTVKKDADIFTAGTKIGRVERVTLVPDPELAPGHYVQVDMLIRADLKIWEDASVIMRSRGILGRAILELERGTPGKRELTPDTPLRGVMAGDPFEALNSLIDENRGNIGRITSDLAQVTGRLSRGEGSIGRILADDGLYRKIDRIAEGLGDVVDRARSPESSFGALLDDRALYDRVLSAVSRIDEIATQIRSGKGTVGHLMYDDDVARDLKDIIARVRGITKAIDEGEGTIGKLVHDDDLHAALVEAVSALRNVAVRLDTGNGSLSRLLADDGQIYENVRVATEDLRVMLDDVRAGKGSLGLLLKDDSAYRELQRMLESFRETGEVARENAPLASLVSFTSLFFNVLN